MKTKKGTLTSTISYGAAAELIGAAPKTVDTSPTDAENEAENGAENGADVSDGEEGERVTTDDGDQSHQSHQTVQPNDGKCGLWMAWPNRRPDAHD